MALALSIWLYDGLNRQTDFYITFSSNWNVASFMKESAINSHYIRYMNSVLCEMLSWEYNFVTMHETTNRGIEFNWIYLMAFTFISILFLTFENFFLDLFVSSSDENYIILDGLLKISIAILHTSLMV